jgi:tRNA (guanine37-N1)-methyltransferase
VLQFDIITLFPDIFQSLNHSITGKALAKHLFSYNLIHLRDFAINQYGQVDDAPFGGEAGMVLRPEPIDAAIQKSICDGPTTLIYMSADGLPLKQAISNELSQKNKITILCGHYKGIDERIRIKYRPLEISIGDFVLSGGEIPALALIDSIVRLIPNAIGDIDSAKTDSFFKPDRLGWPVYTRPANWNNLTVPEVLLSGHHKKIQAWKDEQSLIRTREKRPDLLI